jgi:hypothetical protein
MELCDLFVLPSAAIVIILKRRITFVPLLKQKITRKLNRLLSSAVSRTQFNFSSILSNAKYATERDLHHIKQIKISLPLFTGSNNQ